MILYVIVTQVTKHNGDMTYVIGWSHTSQSQSYNHVTQRRS